MLEYTSHNFGIKEKIIVRKENIKWLMDTHPEFQNSFKERFGYFPEEVLLKMKGNVLSKKSLTQSILSLNISDSELVRKKLEGPNECPIKISQNNSPLLSMKGNFEKSTDRKPLRVIINGPTVASCRRLDDCLRYGVVNVYSGPNGEQSTSKSFYIDGSGDFVENVNNFYGDYKNMFYKEFAKKDNFNALALTKVSETVPLKFKKILNELESSIYSFESGLDLENNPGAINDSITLRSMYDNLVAFINSSDSFDSDTEANIQRQSKTFRTLVKLLKEGADISTSLLPFVGDARDFYEMSTGKDLVTGEKLTRFDRILSGVGLIAGSGAFFRKITKGIKNGPMRVMMKKASKGISGLTYTGKGSWVSDAGLEYWGSGGKNENRLRHVLKHTKPNLKKPSHNVFSSSPGDVPSLIDKAWKKKGEALPDDPGAYVVDMGRSIGTKGERKLKIVVVPGTNRIITAYPIKD